MTTDDEAPVHDLPETSSDERLHIIDETCWCKPQRISNHIVHSEVTDNG